MQNDSKDQVFQAVKRYEPNSKKARKNLAGAASIGSSAGDAFEKVNYLTQAAHFLCEEIPQSPQLGRYYVYNCLQICRKMCLKISPEMKQLWCKYCFTFFIPFQNCSISMQTKRKQKLCVIKCLSCGKPKRYPIGDQKKSKRKRRKNRKTGNRAENKLETNVNESVDVSEKPEFVNDSAGE